MIIPEDDKSGARQTAQSPESLSPAMAGPSGLDKSTEIPSQDPPPYSPPISASSASRTSRDASISPSGMRVNHLYITEQNTAVRGCWTLDPNLSIPRQILPVVPEGERLDNLHLVSHNDAVAARLVLAGGDAPTKSSLHAESHNGKVKVDIVSRTNQRFHLVAKSHNGSVTVRIPRDFHGPVSFTTANESTTFSEAVHADFTLFNRVGKTGRGFVGHWDTSGYPQETKDNWPGDELVLESHNGKIKIFYTDEPVPPKEADLLLRDYAEHGPIGALARSVRRNIMKTMGYDTEAYRSGPSGSLRRP